MKAASHGSLRMPLQNVIEYLPSGVSLFDSELRLVSWNREFKRLLEFPDALLAGGGTHLETLFRYNADRGDYGPGDPEEQVRSRLERTRRMEPHTFERTRPDGTIIEIRGQPLPDGGFVSIYTDITQRKQAEHKYKAILENASIGVLFTRDRQVIHCNPKMAQIFGWNSAEELLGQPGSVFWPSAADYVRIGGIAGPILTSGEAFDVEHLMRRKDNSTFPAHVLAKAVNPATTAEGTIWIVEDVTERQTVEEARRRFVAELEERTAALEKANTELAVALDQLSRTQAELVRSEKLAALGSLVAGIAHELNTPIGNSLMVASHLLDGGRRIREDLQTGLRRSTLDSYLADVQATADILVRGLNKAAELVRSFKQVAVDQTTSQQRPFRLDDVVAEIATMLGPTLRQTPFTLHTEIADGIEMNSFPGPLGQVLTNLISNALTHGLGQRDHGEVRIRGALANDRRQVVLTVSDDGVGISPAILPRIFDPFFTTRVGAGGTGLGLHIVHNIVVGVLAGRIDVRSESGSGAQFVLTLPLSAPRRDRENPEDPDPETRDPKTEL